MSKNSIITMPRVPLDPTVPLHIDEEGSWHAYSYEQVLRILTQDDSFTASYDLGGEDRENSHPIFSGMWACDDPRHRDLRAMAKDPFRPKVLATLSHQIRSIVDELLDTILARQSQSLEVVSDFTRPLAFRTIAMILDVDSADYRKFICWQDELRTVQKVGLVPTQPDFVTYLQELLAQRQRSPRLGLIDELISAYLSGYQVAGKPLSEWDMIAYLATLLTAGSDTTAAGLANTLAALVQFNCLGQLALDRSLISSALEESLRWNPAFPAIRRNIKQDVKFGEHLLRKGQYITAWVSAANRDPSHFGEPDRFEMRRSPNRHLSFGWSKHHCLGAPLARLQMQIALEAFIERIPLEHLRIAQPVEFSHSVVNAPRAAHFAWD